MLDRVCHIVSLFSAIYNIWCSEPRGGINTSQQSTIRKFGGNVDRKDLRGSPLLSLQPNNYVLTDFKVSLCVHEDYKMRYC